MQSIMAVKMRQQDCEMFGHVASEVKKQKVDFKKSHQAIKPKFHSQEPISKQFSVS